MESKGGTVDKAAALFQAYEELEEDERKRFDALADPPGAPIDYDKVVKLKHSLSWQGEGHECWEVKLARNPRANDGMEAARLHKAGTDQVTILFRLLARCSGIPFSALENVHADDYPAVAAQALEWFSPFAV